MPRRCRSTRPLPKNAEEAANREPGVVGTRRVGGHGDRGASEEDRRPATLDIYAKRVADAVRQELQLHDPDERVPLFVFAAEPMLSQFLERAHNHRRMVAVPGASDRLGPAEIDESLRVQLAMLNIDEAESALHGLAEASAGRVERDLAAIGRLAADGAVETLWFDFTTSVNGTLDHESGAIEFATGNGEGEALHDGTHAGDLLPQLALLVIAKGGKVVTVRSDDLDGVRMVGTRHGGTQVRAGLTFRRRMPRAVLVRHPAVAAWRSRHGASPPGPRGWLNPSRHPKRICTSSARESSIDHLDLGLA